MATKTFKIGEYAKGGIIKVITKGNVIQITIHNMYSKEQEEIEAHSETITEYDRTIKCDDLERRLNNFLHEITSSYYAGKVMNWIKDKTKLNFFWS